MSGNFCPTSNSYFVEENGHAECAACSEAAGLKIKELTLRLREADRRVAAQRRELARLNAKTAGAPPTVSVEDAFAAWVIPSLDRWDRRFAHLAYREGWAAARRHAAPSPLVGVVQWLRSMWGYQHPHKLADEIEGLLK